jgi:hypothetical protein
VSKLAHSHPDGLLVECFWCEALFHEDDGDERAGRLVAEPVCRQCGPEVIAEHAQFGVGA